MGFMDKLKGAMNAVTGGAAEVEMTWEPEVATPGQPMNVTVTVKSTGAEIESDGVFVDVWGTETFMTQPLSSTEEAIDELDADLVITVEEDIDGIEDTDENTVDEGPQEDSRTVINEAYKICDTLMLGANEEKTVSGQITLPADLKPTSAEDLGFHYRIRGRLEAFGNDPDTGYKELKVAGGESTPASDVGP